MDLISLIIHRNSEQWITGEGAAPVLVHFSPIFVSSSTTDGLLRNDLSGGGHAPLDPLNPALTLSIITRNVVGECAWNFWEDRPFDKEHLISFLNWSGSTISSVFPLFHQWKIRHFRHYIQTARLADECLWHSFGKEGNKTTNGIDGGLNAMSAL